MESSGVGMGMGIPGEAALFSAPRGFLAEGPYARDGQRHPLSGSLLAATVMSDLKCVAVEGMGEGLRLAVYDRLGGTERVVAQLAPTPSIPGTVALAGTSDAEVVAAAVSARSVQPGETERTTVWVLSANSVLGAPVARLESLGSLLGQGALCFSGATTLWSATRTEDSHFGYLTQWCLLQRSGAMVWEKSAEHILPEFPASALMIPTGAPLDGVVVAANTTLSLWTGAGVFWSRDMQQQIGALALHEATLYVGSGNVLAEVDLDSGDLRKEQPFQSGHVVALAVTDLAEMKLLDQDLDGLSDARDSELGCDPLVDDSDGDGIADGVDPQPVDISPRIQLPREIVFSGRAAGQELRALIPADVRGNPLRWHAAYDPQQLPWLRMYPAEGLSDSPLYLGIDPVEARRGPLASGVVSVEAFDAATGMEAAGSPALVQVSVSSSPHAARLVLWLLTANDTEDTYESLRARLVAPPLYLSQQIHRGPYSGGLDGVNVIVMTTESAAQGALSQREALDYLSGGGALLLTGEAAPGASAYLAHWGAPMGLQFDSSGRLHLDEADAQPRGSGDFAWKGRPVGQGRLALLDAGNSLDTAAPNRLREVRALFDWLCQAGREPDDLDGDGLPNRVEDANANGVRDPGETDRFLVDTDGDGLDDQMEDRNANGHADPGETDARNVDSDGDGVWDGADNLPVPLDGTPVIERLEPAEAPAEGHIEVHIIGRFLPESGSYRIGDREAKLVSWDGPESARILVPDSGGDEGGLVDVEVASVPGALSGVLEKGFRYLPRSRVHLEFSRYGETRLEGDNLHVPTRVVLTPQHAAQWRQASATLRCSLPGGTWTVIPPKEGVGAQLFPLSEAADIQLLIHNTSRDSQQGSAVVDLEWVHAVGEMPHSEIVFEMDDVLALAPSGARLATSTLPTLELHVVP